MKRILLAIICIGVVIVLGFRLAAMRREIDDITDAYPAQGQIIQTDMGDIYTEQTGPINGPPVLLVHGSIGWAALWRETARALGDAGYHAIAFDMPPMGYSERDPSGDYRRLTQAKRLLSLVQALGVRPVLVAHSFGAGAGTEAVMRTPDAFAGFVIVDGALGVGSHENPGDMPLLLRPKVIREMAVSLSATNPLATKFLLAQFLHRKERANNHYAAILQRPLVLRGSTAAIATWVPTLLVPPIDAKSTRVENFREISLPVAILWGEEDTTTPLDQAYFLAKNIPGADLILMSGLGHIPQIEDPDQFNTALIKALKGMENRS